MNKAEAMLNGWREAARELAIKGFRTKLEDRFAGPNALDEAADIINEIRSEARPEEGSRIVNLEGRIVEVPMFVARLLSNFMLLDGLTAMQLIRANVPELDRFEGDQATDLILEAVCCRMAKDINKQRREKINALVSQYGKMLDRLEGATKLATGEGGLEEIESVLGLVSSDQENEPPAMRVHLVKVRVH